MGHKVEDEKDRLLERVRVALNRGCSAWGCVSDTPNSLAISCGVRCVETRGMQLSAHACCFECWVASLAGLAQPHC